MNKRFTYGKLPTRRAGTYITPEKLTTLKMIFDAVCDELAIPSDATIERELLATRIMVMGRTVESEMILVTTAMEAVADHRQELSWRWRNPRTALTLNHRQNASQSSAFMLNVKAPPPAVRRCIT